MTLKNFLKLHQNGCACVSVHQLPYDHVKHRYTETYFEEASQEDIEQDEIFREIKDRQINHFNIIGGDMYPVELCIYLKKVKS